MVCLFGAGMRFRGAMPIGSGSSLPGFPSGGFLEDALVRLQVGFVEQDKTDAADSCQCGQLGKDRPEGDPGRRLGRVAESSGGQGGKGYGGDAGAIGKPQGIAVSRGQQDVGRTVSPVYRTQTVDHMPVRQAVRRCHNGLPRPDRRQGPALCLEPRPGGAVDRAGNAAAAAQPRVGRVDNGLHVGLVGDVALHALDGFA